jgi:OOP family OmpA-OmpF porin
MKRTWMTAMALTATALALPGAALADSGLYFGGSIGSASLDDGFDEFVVDDSSTAYRVTLGWQFSDFLAIEAGYHDFGTFEDSFTVGGEPLDLRLEADGFMLGGTASLPLAGSLWLYGRAGAFIWDGDANVNSITEARPEDTNPYYGGGAKVSLTNRLDLVGDWTRFELKDTNSDVISLGFTYRF